MKKIMIIVVALTAVVGGAAWLQMSGAFVSEELPPAQPIEPPSDAWLLEEGVEPAAVITAVTGKRDPDEKQAVIEEFTGMWLPPRGWDGEAMDVRVGGGVTRFAIEIHDTIVVGRCIVACEVPGAVESLVEGRPVRFRGRIKDIRESPDLMTMPHKIFLDQVTVLRAG